MSGIDAEIDALYALPLTGFIAARNQLARAHKGATAARIKKLAKPATVAWAVNQLYWHERQAWQRLMQTGRALRTAQIAALEGRRGDLRKTADAHRQALADSVQHVLALAGREGASPSPDQVSRMLETVSLSERVEQPGRFTEVVQPAGFEALAGVTPIARPEAAEPSGSAHTAAPRATDHESGHGAVRAGTREVAAAHRTRETNAAAAAAKAAAARAAARRAAEEAVTRAERAVQDAETEEQRAAEHVVSVRHRLAEAEEAHRRRRDELADARHGLAKAREELRRAGA